MHAPLWEIRGQTGRSRVAHPSVVLRLADIIPAEGAPSFRDLCERMGGADLDSEL